MIDAKLAPISTTKLGLVSGATSGGTIRFYLYAGTCASITRAPSAPPRLWALVTAEPRSSTVLVPSLRRGWSPGHMSGCQSTRGAGRRLGGPHPPQAPVRGAVSFGGSYYDCEPITLASVSHGVPEFSAGLPILMALALPALLLLRRRLPHQ
jgi:hypothetical protein